MNRLAYAFLFATGAAIASPFAVWASTVPLPHTLAPMQAAIYTAVEDGKVSDAVIRSHATRVSILEEITVVGHVRARMPKPKPPSAPACKLRALEQQGSPSSPFVLECV